LFRGKNTRRRLGWGLCSAIVGLLGAAIPVALATGWGSSYSYLSTDTGANTQESPAVAVNGKGDVSALWLDDSTATTPTTATLDARSDAGNGFGTVAEITTTADPLRANDEDYPQVAEDAAADTLAVWISNGKLMAGYRAPGAPNFTTTTLDAAGSGTKDQFPELTMDPAGDAVVTWEQNDETHGTWSVEYAALAAGSSTFGTPQALTTGLQSEPYPHVASNASGAAVIVWVDGAFTSLDYAYSPSITDPTFASHTATGYSEGADSGDNFLDPVVAIAADGNAAVAWDRATDGANTVFEGDLPASVALASTAGAFPDGHQIGTGNGDGSALGSYDQENPSIAMKPDTPGDDTTALAFWNGSENEVAAFIRPSSDYGTSWLDLGSTTWSTADQGWVEEGTSIADTTDDSSQPQVALSSSAAGEDGPLAMVWTDDDGVYSVTSDPSGAFSSGPVTLEGSRPPVSCNTANGSCVELAATPSGDISVVWQQNDGSSHIQVVADCYQASATVAATTASDQSACNSLTATTTTATATTATATTASTPSTTTTTPATPKVAQTIVATTVTGTVMVLLPGSRTPVPLNSLQSIPNGSVVEPGSGTVTLTFALPDGQTETGTFWGGDFKVLQAPGGGVDLTLVGGSFAGCPAPPSHKKKPKLTASAAKAKKPIRKKPGSPVRSLWSNAKGNFTTKGQNGAAAVLGTTWLTRDQCDGTYFYVKSTSNDPQGAIEVTVLHPHRHRVKLKRGHSLLAPAPGYS